MLFFLLKRGCLLLLLTAFCLSLNAQNNNIQKIKTYIENSTHFYQKEAFDKAEIQANSAFLLAEKEGSKKWMAIALQKEALALLGKTRRLKANRKKARKKLEQSLLLSASIDDRQLRLELLERLKWLAEVNKETEKVANYDLQIREINQSIETNEEKGQLEAETQNLSSTLKELNVQQQFLRQEIQSLSQAQLESKLLISLQKSQVDSLRFKQAMDSMILAQNEMLLAEQTAQLQFEKSKTELQRSQRNLFLALAGIIALICIGVFVRFLETKKLNTVLATKNKIIETERKKSDKLLLNILPAIVADELKTNGIAKAKRYENATVFFSDFKNFSSIAKRLSPEVLVKMLDYYFKKFDQIIEKYHLEKIKTIGDAYMCVSGLPKENTEHALDVLRAAMDIQTWLLNEKKAKEKLNEPYFEARIGIHTGPLVAGIVGSKKFAFDVWGDTVNIAARLESRGQVGKINISKETYQLVKKDFSCAFRGKIPIKNRGEVEMYFVE